jgi:hypothetical protein
MHAEDQRNRFAEEVFTCRIYKDGRVCLSWRGKQVKILKGAAAADFIEKVAGLDQRSAQLLMAKVTGNFKRGNERR